MDYYTFFPFPGELLCQSGWKNNSVAIPRLTQILPDILIAWLIDDVNIEEL
jgi:hypothetical protein